MKTSIPAYYRDKKGREEKTAELETQIRQIMEAVLSGDPSINLNKLVADLFSVEFEPKFMDDTRFVVVSRFHVAITAMQIWRYKYATGKECQIPHTKTLDNVVKFLKKTYLPFCKDLQSKIFDKYSNHGALALMGETIATKYIIENDDTLTPVQKTSYKGKLTACGKKLENRVEKAVLDKNRWCGKRDELWVENLRNKKGLYYTYLHLAALVRTLVTLTNSKVTVADQALDELHRAYQQYQRYFYDPKSWPYRDRTRIWGLRQLQGLIFPADEFVEPRPFGKEGAFMDVCSNKVYPLTSLPFESRHKYTELGPIPYSTQIMDSAFDLWKLL